MTPDPRPQRPPLTEQQRRTKDRRFIMGLVCLGLAIPLCAVVLLKQERREPVVFYRVATFNTSMFRGGTGDLAAELDGGANPQAQRVAAIIQEVKPHILLLNEFDHDPSGRALRIFQEQYLEVPQGERTPITYASSFTRPVNTGVPSGMDLDGDRRTDGPGDALGYGAHPGQYGMAVLTTGAILQEQVRTFRSLKWTAMPDHRMPTGFYSEAAQAVLPLSSKSHWDIPIVLGQGLRPVHLLASHPTPPVFDGPEDRNGRRNADEIRLWADYVSGDPSRAGWIRDDAGVVGGLGGEAMPDGSTRPALFVIAGDLNADPVDGDTFPGAIQQLLDHPRITDPLPRSAGGDLASTEQWGANSTHKGDPALDTGDFPDGELPDGGRGPGNMRLDYVLPSADLKVVGSGVFWPVPGSPAARLLGTADAPTSDHRPVFVDLAKDSLLP